MLTFLLTAAAAFAGSFVYCSFFEWVLHRYLMHTDRFLKYPFRTHQLEHHEFFRADSTYFLQKAEHRAHLTFAWWNAPLLIGLHAPAFALLYFLAGGWASLAGALLAIIAYYALYEYLHYCMHSPCGRFFERTRFFRFVQTHHRLHHVYFHKNLNVVVPIADVLLRTRIGLKDRRLFERLERVRLRRLQRRQRGRQRAASAAAFDAPLLASPASLREGAD